MALPPTYRCPLPYLPDPHPHWCLFILLLQVSLRSHLNHASLSRHRSTSLFAHANSFHIQNLYYENIQAASPKLDTPCRLDALAGQ